MQPTAKLNIGFIAQEIEEVFPELVAEQPNGFQGVNYPQFVPILLEAIKEQQTIIEEQAEKMQTLHFALERHDQKLLELSKIVSMLLEEQ